MLQKGSDDDEAFRGRRCTLVVLSALDLWRGWCIMLQRLFSVGADGPTRKLCLKAHKFGTPLANTGRR